LEGAHFVTFCSEIVKKYGEKAGETACLWPDILLTDAGKVNIILKHVNEEDTL